MMPSSISRKMVTDLCHEGVEDARKKYETWSGGWSLRVAPESLTQASIAEKLATSSPYVTLEDKITYLLKMSRAMNPHSIPGGKNQRADITLWNGNSTPRFVIEVKKLSGNDCCSRDAARLRWIISRCPSISAGFVVAITHAVEKHTISKKFQSIGKKISASYEENISSSQAYSKMNRYVYFGCACFLITAS